MKRVSPLAALAAAMLTLPCLAANNHVSDPKIQIAILLDTSGSMDGLLNQTREQLWRIVNTFATARREGKRPRLELALYEYGNTAIRSPNWIRQVVPLTTDLDKVSEALFSLHTNGGDEYCGAVIQSATRELEWSGNPGDLKLIYIAGNEPFTQGPVDFHGSVKTAIAKGIVVNTIHAGDEAAGIAGKWKEAALLADGNFLFIDQNRAVARVDAPQDRELAQLNEKLNQTYVRFGAEGEAAAARQVAQDKNAQGMSMSALATRAASKSTAEYDNSNWDLVDAKQKGLQVDAVPAAALPAALQQMSKPERTAFVEAKAKERGELQGKIAKLAQEREAFVQGELKQRATSNVKTLDDALIESAKAQAKKQAYTF